MVMNRKQLRIGNKVLTKYSRQEVEIEELHKNVAIIKGDEILYNLLEPIPITEERLIEKGFVKDRQYLTLPISDYGYSLESLAWRDGDWSFGIEYYDPMDEKDTGVVFPFIGCGFKYMHQLENLLSDLEPEKFG